MTISSVASADAKHPEFIWRNKEIVSWEKAMVHVNSVGHASVSSVFEGIKAYWNKEEQQLYIFRLREHMQRMLDSFRMVRLGNELSLEELENGVIDILRANKTKQDTYIRPWAFAKGFVHEQMVPADAPTEVVIDSWPFQTHMLTDRGCKVCISSWTRISDNVMPPRAKVFSNYHNGRMALMEAKTNGFDYPVFLNERHKITEGPGACVAMVRNGKVVTPNTTSGILESITRESLLRLIPEVLNVQVIEREVDRTELYVADEIFFIGTGWEVLPIVNIDGLTVGNGKMGPVARAIDRAYHDVVRGINDCYKEWRAPVW